jgi:hypothetical protein
MTTRTTLILLLLSCFVVFVYAIGGYQKQMQYAKGIANSTSAICINDKCLTTMCINNEPCRTFKSNSSTAIPDNSTKNNNNIFSSPVPLETV